MRSAGRAVGAGGRSGRAPWSATWSAWSGRSGSDGPDDPDERWLTAVLHIAFFLLLGSSLVRYLIRDTGGAPNGWVIALFVAFGAL